MRRSELAPLGADALHLASVLAVAGADTLFAAWTSGCELGPREVGVRVVPAG